MLSNTEVDEINLIEEGNEVDYDKLEEILKRSEGSGGSGSTDPEIIIQEPEEEKKLEK